MTSAESFAVFVISHARARNVITIKTLRDHGYSGRWFVVVDDGDPQLEEYRAEFGERLLVFSKAKLAGTFDIGISSGETCSSSFPRNALWELARSVGVRYFVQLDDDTENLKFRCPKPDGPQYRKSIRRLDRVFEVLVGFLRRTPFVSIAMCQGGDFIGGVEDKPIELKRKCMNSFVCDVEKPFAFVGLLNEDVNTYLSLWNRGVLLGSYSGLQLEQERTQQNAGGMTGAYLSHGTYTKSMFSVMWLPSSVRVSTMGRIHRRIHHKINWRTAVPKIVSERHRRVAAESRAN